MSWTRLHDSKQWPSVDILQGEVDQVAFRVNTNCVGMGNRHRGFGHQIPAVLPEDRDLPRFCRDIQPLQSRIKGKHIRILAHRVAGQNLHGIEINDNQRIVRLPRYKRQPVGHVEGNTVGSFRPCRGIAAHNLGCCRINGNQFAGLVDRNQDVP